MSVPRTIVENRARRPQRLSSAAARSRTWLFYKLWPRFREEGEAGLLCRRRAPKKIANRIPDQVEEAIVELRKELSDGGWDSGAVTIAFHLPTRLEPGTVIPLEATSGGCCNGAGSSTPTPRRPQTVAGDLDRGVLTARVQVLVGSSLRAEGGVQPLCLTNREKLEQIRVASLLTATPTLRRRFGGITLAFRRVGQNRRIRGRGSYHNRERALEALSRITALMMSFGVAGSYS